MCIDEKWSTVISLSVPSLQNVKIHPHHPFNFFLLFLKVKDEKISQKNEFFFLGIAPKFFIMCSDNTILRSFFPFLDDFKTYTVYKLQYISYTVYLSLDSVLKRVKEVPFTKICC
jgi:hypothetical protein